jgi:hypothetical protein
MSYSRRMTPIELFARWLARRQEHARLHCAECGVSLSKPGSVYCTYQCELDAQEARTP